MDVGGSAMQGRETDGSDCPRASHACPLSTCYPATLHIVASVRAPMIVPLDSPATAMSRTYVKRAVHPKFVFRLLPFSNCQLFRIRLKDLLKMVVSLLEPLLTTFKQ
eukprot:22560-Prymnesium_polylepis.1